MEVEQSTELTGTNRVVRLGHVSKANFEARVRDSDCESAAPSFASLALRCDPQISGGVLEEATPDPIPNSEVKLLGADGTAREAVWESRTLPGLFPCQEAHAKAWAFCF